MAHTTDSSSEWHELVIWNAHADAKLRSDRGGSMSTPVKAGAAAARAAAAAAASAVETELSRSEGLVVFASTDDRRRQIVRVREKAVAGWSADGMGGAGEGAGRSVLAVDVTHGLVEMACLSRDDRMLCVCETIPVDSERQERSASILRVHWIDSNHSERRNRGLLPEHVIVGSRVCAIALAGDVLVVAEDALISDGMCTPPGSPDLQSMRDQTDEMAISKVSVRSVATGAVLAVYDHAGLVAAVDIVRPTQNRGTYVLCVAENEDIELGDGDDALGIDSPSSPTTSITSGSTKVGLLEIGKVTIRSLNVDVGGGGHKASVSTSTTSVAVLPAIQSEISALRLTADGGRVAIGAGKHVLLFRQISRRRKRRPDMADRGSAFVEAPFADEWEMEFGTAHMRFTTNVTQLSSGGGSDEVLLVSLAGGLCSQFEWQLLSLGNSLVPGTKAGELVQAEGSLGRRNGAQPSVSDAFRVVSAMLHAMPDSNYQTITSGGGPDQDALSPRDVHRHRSARHHRNRSGTGGLSGYMPDSSAGSIASPAKNIPALRYRKRTDSYKGSGRTKTKAAIGSHTFALDSMRESHRPVSPVSSVMVASPYSVGGRSRVQGAQEQQLWSESGDTSVMVVCPAEMDWAWAAEQMLAAYPELISAQDGQGNTLLHMAVNQCIHESEVLGVLKLISSVIDPADVGFVPDKDGKTALQLAVDRRYPRAVEHLLRMSVCGGPRSRRHVTPSLASLIQQYPRMAVGFLHSIGLEDAGPEVWSTKLGEEMIVRATPTPFGAARLWAGFSRKGNPRIPVIARLIGLEGLAQSHEVMHALAAGGKHGSTSMHLELFETDIVRVLLQFKWEKFGLWIHAFHMGLYICFIVVYSFWLYRVHWTGHLGQDINKHQFDDHRAERSLATVDIAVGFVAMFFAVLFLAIEGLEFAVGPRSYVKSGWNLVDCASGVLVLTAIICWLTHNEDALWVAIFATPMTYIRSLNFLRGFRATGALVSIISAVTIDVMPFCIILCIVVATFAASFFLLGEFYHKSESMFKTYIMLLGEFYAEDEDGEFVSGTSRLFFAIFTAVASVMMLNLLIAIICDTYERVKERELPQFLLERLRILCRIEKIAEFLKLDVNLAFQLNADPWLHVLMPTQRIERLQWSGRLKMIKDCTADHAASTQDRISSVESELGEAIHSLRRELDSGVGGVRREMGARQTRMEAQLELLISKLVPSAAQPQQQRAHYRDSSRANRAYLEQQHLQQQQQQQQQLQQQLQQQQGRQSPSVHRQPRGPAPPDLDSLM
jgi:hypothetical protein